MKDSKLAALIGWTGNGKLQDLERTVVAELPHSRRLRVTRVGNALVLLGQDPVAVARRIADLPGVSWTAGGYEFEGVEDCITNVVALARKYLRRGSSFKIVTQVEGGASEGDISLEANSAVLKAVEGTHVGEKNPKVRFRIVMADGRGACGVESRRGVGGVPTSKEMEVTCLVSGGYHSAVMAWMAALSGYSVHLVHPRTDDESLRQVARLYSELSRRMDPSSLDVVVLTAHRLPSSSSSPSEPRGGEEGAAGRLGAWLDRAGARVLAGVHPACRGKEAPDAFQEYPSVLFPLLLVQEDEIRSRLEEIRLKEKPGDAAMTLPTLGERSDAFVAKAFRGREADQNEVLDSLLG